jgi:hypothetical protein
LIFLVWYEHTSWGDRGLETILAPSTNQQEYHMTFAVTMTRAEYIANVPESSKTVTLDGQPAFMKYNVILGQMSEVVVLIEEE